MGVLGDKYEDVMQSNIFKNCIDRVVGSSCEVRSHLKDCAAQHSVEYGDEKRVFICTDGCMCAWGRGPIGRE